MASTSNAENFMKIAGIVYQLCDYTHFRADFLQTRICGKWLVFANQVTYVCVTFRNAIRNLIQYRQTLLLRVLLGHCETSIYGFGNLTTMNKIIDNLIRCDRVAQQVRVLAVRMLSYL